jgi:hypothetical protein
VLLANRPEPGKKLPIGWAVATGRSGLILGVDRCRAFVDEILAGLGACVVGTTLSRVDVTLDLRGCQRNVCETIIAGSGDSKHFHRSGGIAP